ncbi:MAG: FtsK/SpoIIIE domain-containing protein, partial [Acidimicrobiales bacterium]
MRLKLGLVGGRAKVADVAVVVEPTVSIGQLAAALASRDPGAAAPGESGAVTLAPWAAGSTGVEIPPDLSLLEAGVRSGATVQVVPARDSASSTAVPGAGVATLRVLAGPDAGREFELPEGTSYIGRDPSCDVRLGDPMVSKHHAKLHITSVAEIVDTNSSNGILVDGDLVPRVVLHPDDVAVLGDTQISVFMRVAGAEQTLSGTAVSFNRSPRINPIFSGLELAPPELPEPERGQRFPIIPLVIPVALGTVMYLITKSVLSIAFVALTPAMMLGNFVEGRITRKRSHASDMESFRSAMEKLEAQLGRAREEERAVRRREHPPFSEIATAVEGLHSLVWARRPSDPGFLQVRLGLGSRLSRSSVSMPPDLPPSETVEQLLALRDRYALVDGVPVVADLRACALGLADDNAHVQAVANGVMAQIVGLHSPAEVVVAALASTASAVRWDWLKWTPHVSSPSSPLGSHHLAVGRNACLDLIGEIELLIESRSKGGGDNQPWVVLLVEDDASIDRSRLVQVAEKGPTSGVSVIWRAASTTQLPAACRTYVDAARSGGNVRVVFVDDASAVPLTEIEQVDANGVLSLARRLSPLIDSGARVEDASDLPSAVSFVSLAGAELIESPRAILERWVETNSIIDRRDDAPRRRSKESGLRAMIGQSATQTLHLDLRAHGPHALVGGTTGAGKSELLQSWIMGMATAYSPDRVTFLLVDYKGGSAFGDCRFLPHTVGMVTDLSPHLARRALTSLAAELTYREHILNRKRAKDLIELERMGDPDTPPSLVIVIDEFAALVQELPEFVEGVVNVAQRGRSLGLHLVLATQRPAGVIKDNLRANTNLRIALRMADEADSTDVLGTPVAASFDPGIPGRASAKLGPGRLVAFQAAYVGGRSSAVPPPPVIVVEDLVFGPPRVWEEPADPAMAELHAGTDDADGLADIQRLVITIQNAADEGRIVQPRRPWLPELASVYELRRLSAPRTDAELVFGVRDDPEHQTQPPASFTPDRDGNMIVYGTGGSGKSTTLRTLAIASGFSVRGGPCHVYGLDFGVRGLAILEDLPHVGSVINGDDTELVGRLLRMLRDTIDQRARRYAQARADTITDYRDLAQAPDEPRLLLLVDGVGAFRQAYEAGDRAKLFDMFVGIAQDGRPMGVHVVATADRPAALPAALASTMQQRVVLRLANENDVLMLGIPKDAFDADTPPGRGFHDDLEVQIAVFGGSANVAEQAAATNRLAVEMRRRGIAEARPVERLRDQVALSELPT